MASAPWLKFYPTDWQSDPALRMCSLAARGLWQEMLCIMHKAEPYGSLVVNGKAIGPKQLAILSGAPAREVETCLAEQEEHGVFSRDANGTIYSRRMRRDREKAERDKANGKGGGNPDLVGPRDDTVNPKRPKKPPRGLTPPLTPTLAGEDKAQSQKPESDPEGTQHQQQPQCSEAVREPAAKSLISPEAHAIAEEIWKAAGFTKENLPVAWCGSPWKIQKFLEDGCPGDLVRDTAIAIVKNKRDGPPNNFSYFDKPIKAAHASINRPLPTVITPPGQTIEAANGSSRKPSIIDHANGRIADIDARIAEATARENRLRASESPPRLLPPDRRD